MSDPRRESINLRRQENRKAIRELINGYKENVGCKDCPSDSNHPHYLLEFDHIGLDKKIADVSRMIGNELSIHKIFKEIKKCEVVCRNHHAIRTHKRRNGLPLTGDTSTATDKYARL